MDPPVAEASGDGQGTTRGVIVTWGTPLAGRTVSEKRRHGGECGYGQYLGGLTYGPPRHCGGEEWGLEGYLWDEPAGAVMRYTNPPLSSVT